MYKHDHSKPLTRAAFTLCALAALGGGAAGAQTEITSLSQLGALTSATPAYTGPDQGQAASPFSTSAGTTAITMTDQNPLNVANGDMFTKYFVSAANPLDFEFGAYVLETANALHQPLGPLQIDFSTPGGSGVSGFGLKVQDFAFDKETFTVQVFTDGSSVGTTLIPTYTADNSSGEGTSIFVGALSATGSTITRAVISSTSIRNGEDTGSADDFFFGGVTITNAPPVPEASTVVGFGTGVLLFAGLAVGARRRKMGRAPQSAG